MPTLLSMAAQMSVLRPIRSYSHYLRSAQRQFPFKKWGGGIPRGLDFAKRWSVTKRAIPLILFIYEILLLYVGICMFCVTNNNKF